VVRAPLAFERKALSNERKALSNERKALSNERKALSNERKALSNESEVSLVVICDRSTSEALVEMNRKHALHNFKRHAEVCKNESCTIKLGNGIQVATAEAEAAGPKD